MRRVFNQDIAKTSITIVIFGIAGAPQALADGASCGKGVGGVDMGVYPMSNITSIDQATPYTNGGLIGNGECATLTKALTPGISNASGWTRGVQVQGDGAIPIGAPIATFNYSSGPDSNGYGPPNQPGGASGVSHTGIYMGQDRNGVWILDQWSTAVRPRLRQLPWGPGGSSATGSTCAPGECGGKYYVIGNGNGANSPPNAALNGGDGSGGPGGGDTGGLCSVPSPGGGYVDISGGGGNGGGSTGGGGMGGVGGGGTTGPGGTGGVGGGGTTGPGGTGGVGGGGTGGGTTGGWYGGGGTTGGGAGIGSATFGPVPTLPRAQGAAEIPILEGKGD